MQTKSEPRREERLKAKLLARQLSSSMRNADRPLSSGERGLRRLCFVSHQRIHSLDRSQAPATSEEKGPELLSLQGSAASPGLVKMQTSTLRMTTSGAQSPCLRNPTTAAASRCHLSLTERGLYARLYPKGFVYIVQFYPYNNPGKSLVPPCCQMQKPRLSVVLPEVV